MASDDLELLQDAGCGGGYGAGCAHTYHARVGGACAGRFSGTNGKIAFDSFPPGEADPEIFTLTYNPGGAVPEDPSPPLTNNTSQDSGAAWSPDGLRIAFERNSEIWVMSTLSDDNAVRLTNNRGIDEYPDWQPKPRRTG